MPELRPTARTSSPASLFVTGVAAGAAGAFLTGFLGALMSRQSAARAEGRAASGLTAVARSRSRTARDAGVVG